jgi:uncharacterized membrane protein
MTAIATPDSPIVTWRRRTGYWWFVLSAVAIATFAVTPYLVASLPALARNDVGVARNYVDRGPFITGALYVHVTCGGLALLLSPLQFAARVRNRLPRLHRWVGRLVLVAILVGGTAAVVISTVNLAGPIGTAGFGLLGVSWIGCAVTAYLAIRRGDVLQHRRWMIRTFSLTYAAVTLRIWIPLMVALQAAVFGVDGDVAFDRIYHVVPFLCWVPNLLVAQWFLSRDASSRPVTG